MAAVVPACVRSSPTATGVLGQAAPNVPSDSSGLGSSNVSAHDANIAELRRIAPDLAPSIAKLTIPAYILDRDATVRWLNAAAVARFGDLRGKHIGQIVEPADVALARREFAAKLLGTQEATEGEVTIRTANGGRQTVEISSTQLLDQGAIVGVFGMASPPTSLPPPRPTARNLPREPARRSAPPRGRPLHRRDRGQTRHRDRHRAQPCPRDSGAARGAHPARGSHSRPRPRTRPSCRMTHACHSVRRLGARG